MYLNNIFPINALDLISVIAVKSVAQQPYRQRGIEALLSVKLVMLRANFLYTVHEFMLYAMVQKLQTQNEITSTLFSL